MPREPETRLVYSTGGDAAHHEQRPDEKRSNQLKAAGRGGAGPVRLSLERRASDRQVTIVRGLTGSAEQIAEVARALKTACGTGGSVKGDVIELQGDRRDAAFALLAASGIKARKSGG
jgi:translation initiation factor 1